jgi:tetratricopeptide (TPR) repeat protein
MRIRRTIDRSSIPISCMFISLTLTCWFGLAAASAQTGTAAKPSLTEAAALQAMLGAQVPDDQIRTAEELLTGYPNTTYKAYARLTEANAYEAKNDHARAISYCEQALTADSKDFDAEVLIANIIAGEIRDTDPDKADKLARVDKAAQEALALIKTAPKTALFQMTNDQWNSKKNYSAMQAWQALGMAATAEQKTDEAIADYEKGLALSPDPGLMLRLGRTLEMSQKYDEAIDWFDKAITSPNVDQAFKEIALSDKARATAAKARQ